MNERDVGVVTYLDNHPPSLYEITWLYKSWVYSGSSEVSDMIIFHNPEIRKDLIPRHENILHVPVVPLSKTNPDWAYYPHINGTWFLTTREAGYLIRRYKYLVRTDPDCFFTNNFPNLRPRLAMFGTSAFSKRAAVNQRLLDIATKWEINQYFTNVGGTVMGFSDDVISYSHIQLEYCHKLRDEEFKDGYGEWPGWFKGVINMYAGQLAANAYFSNNMVLGGLDVFCMSDDNISPQDYMIHAWHTWNYFSKLRWRAGEYDHVDFDKLNTNKINDYCLWIAGRKDIK